MISFSDKIKQLFSQSVPLKPASQVSTPSYVDWASILGKDWERWQAAITAAHCGPRVLIATSMGGFQGGALLESTLAVALTLRGAKVDILLCDSFLPGCQLTEIGNINPKDLLASQPQPRCATCYPSGKRVFEPLGLPIYWYSQLVIKQQAAEAQRIAQEIPLGEIENYRLDNMAVGEHAMAGALRYFARGDLQGEPAGEVILRLYLKSALLTVYATRALARRNKYDVACFNHGIYAPQGLIGEVCRQEGLRVVNWNPAYRKHTFIFSHNDSYHHTMITEPKRRWEDLTWSQELETPLLDYLQSRWVGTQDWIWFHEKPEEDLAQIAQETGVDFSRPVIGALTSVMWDAKLHYHSNAFPNMVEWIKYTIEYFAQRPDLQLLIRVHPAEVRGTLPSRQLLMAEIRGLFPTLPHNVFVIPPESQVSTYAAMEQCDTVIIYNTKTGIEISSMGIPVIVAGEAWIRNKGFSLDASSPVEYRRLLDQLPLMERLSPQELQRARKYAFHFFFRRMIPLPFINPVEPKAAKMRLDLNGLDELYPGKYPGLDIICEGVLKSADFDYPAEMHIHADAQRAHAKEVE